MTGKVSGITAKRPVPRLQEEDMCKDSREMEKSADLETT